jgi:hypothetical protein
MNNQTIRESRHARNNKALGLRQLAQALGGEIVGGSSLSWSWAFRIPYSVGRDSPDGQLWPPDSAALWIIVRHADGCTPLVRNTLLKSDRCHGL